MAHLSLSPDGYSAHLRPWNRRFSVFAENGYRWVPALRIRGRNPPLQLLREPIGRVKSAPEKSAPSKRVGRRGFARSAPMAEAWRAAIAALRFPARARAETAQIFILPTLARGIFRRFGRIVLPACGVLE